MCGISNRFVSDYRNLRNNDGKLSAGELKQLSNLIVSAGNNTDAIKALKNEILADGGLDEEEKKLLLTIGFSSDESALTQIKSHLSPASDNAVSRLLAKGFEQKQSAIRTYEAENPKIAVVRNNTASAANTAIGFVKKYTPEAARSFVNDLVGRDNTRNRIEINDTSEAAIFTDQKTTNRFFNEENLRTLTASERNDCVANALNAVGVVTSKKESIVINEGNLKKITNKDWDAINVAHYKNDTNQMKNLLDGQAGKAIVVAGTHTFVFQGLDKDGNLRVTDPSDKNVARLISKDNPAATVYIQKVNGKGGDGAKTNKANNEAAAVGFNAFSNGKIINSADKPANASPKERERANESLNVRKLLVLLGDKDQASTSTAIINILENKSLSPDAKAAELQKILKAKGIQLNNDEVKAFAFSMTQPINEKVDKNKVVRDPNGGYKDDKGNKVEKVGNDFVKKTTMCEQLKTLGSRSAQERANYTSGIEYSDIDLSDQFTKTNPAKLFESFKDLLAGRGGC